MNAGAVTAVRGSVVDVQFDQHLPAIHTVLHANDGRIVLEVLAQRDAHQVRAIALTPTQGLARGMSVLDTGGPLKTPVGKTILSRMFDVFGNVIADDGIPGSGQAVEQCGLAHVGAAHQGDYRNHWLLQGEN